MEDLHQGHARSENTVTLIFVFVMALILRNDEKTRIRDSKVEYGKELELSFINYHFRMIIIMGDEIYAGEKLVRTN